MTELLIDDVGYLWSGTAVKMRESFDSPRSSGDFNEYAVRVLGFIGLSEFRSTYQIRLNPECVTRRSFETLQYILEGRKNDKIIIARFNGAWAYDVATNVLDAIARVEGLVSATRQTTASLYMARPSTYSAAKLNSAREEAAELTDRDWLEIDRRQRKSAIVDAFGTRFTVVRADKSDRLIIDRLGSGMYAFDKTWRPTAIGRHVEDQPDREFARWTMNGFRSAWELGSPKVDDIDVITYWTGPARSRWRYKRCVLPFNGADGQKRLLCGSILSPSIDLRADAFDEIAHV